MTQLPQTSAARPTTGRERFLAAVSLQPVDRPPVWFMRQAGRHLPGYRALRERCSFMDLCRDPEVNRIASAEPLHRYGVDAVIVFNDILIPLRDMGMSLDFLPAPRFGRLIRTPQDVAALAEPAYDQRTDVARCLRALRVEAGEQAATIGFVGAPFTVAAFAIAGVGSERVALGESIRTHGGAYGALQGRLIDVLAEYARVQAEAGADVIQVFESLADHLPPEDYRRVGLPCLLQLIQRTRQRCGATPLIVFGRGLWPFLPGIASAGVALSLDSAHPLSEARSILSTNGLHVPLQGNLDPQALLLDPSRAAEAATALLASWRGIVPHPERAGELGPTGWVFNLGHGVPPQADPESVQAVVDAVRAFRLTPSATSAATLSLEAM